ncbi:hypothetical protein [Archangium sp.]|uniref:hypothetical protein n=1 Tax=Archangium sp. TaxID=1872627 RepID=UPI00389997CD
MKDSKGGVLQSSRIEDAPSTISRTLGEGGAMLELTSNYLLLEVPLLDGSCEDGLSLSRRSVFTEKLLPPTRTPAPRRPKRRSPRELGPFDTLPV